MRRQYELMQMDEGEKISEFFTRIITQTNAMKSCGEKIEDARIVETILRIVTPRFDHVVVAIEESENVERMKVEELQGSLEAHEQRLNERGAEKHSHQALQAQTCQAPNKNHQYGRQESEANLVKEDEEDLGDIVVQLMMTTSSVNGGSDIWYLDLGCSNHMIGNREWLVNFDPNRRSKVKFADQRVITVEGTCDVPLIMANGRKAYISDVLFVPDMKTNLINIGQLHEKGLTMQLLNGFMTIYDNLNRKILKAPLTRNRTFQVKLGAGMLNA
ncbi:PREDICTED: uncharacterized protein LOC109338201 [Lupinus angustifolius]|uniref:uncharacterized protein LOC109338201 n=1 Tax=Lupinus angustifolius TaxID=3871 RepID=UPI00092E8657|nr:PREDICTED: uncharacterized protein LOC109338201 [Lupinus angustifolius]